MLHNPKYRIGFRVLLGVCTLAISIGLNVSTSIAQDADAAKPAVSPEKRAETQQRHHTAPRESKPYFIEFRARSAESYGHTFLVHGRLGQKITAKDVIGLHPFSESPIPWMIGHIIPVVSETGASDGDYEEEYIIARYRVLLSQAEYKKVLGYMKERQRNSPLWHAAIYNCNAFVKDIAGFMGLKTPFLIWLYPKEFITQLGELNGVTQKEAWAIAAKQDPANKKRQRPIVTALSR